MNYPNSFINKYDYEYGDIVYYSEINKIGIVVNCMLACKEYFGIMTEENQSETVKSYFNPYGEMKNDMEWHKSAFIKIGTL